jgi:alpha-beta hydrolase superfamily lysophospholipase
MRDETAQVLAKQLSAEHAEHPQATQLIIAHSHGGNIALPALPAVPHVARAQSYPARTVTIIVPVP